MEKITIRGVDTTVVTPPDIIRATRPLVFHDTIYVENERVKTEVFIDTIFQEVEVESEVKPFEHEVKIKEVVKEKVVKKEPTVKWWVWLVIGVLIIPVIRLTSKILA
jgi:hypothetical protein